MAGEYAGGIFWIVGIAMMASWVVAIVFTPYLGVLMLPNDMHPHHGNAYNGPLYRRLRMIIEACVRHRGKVLIATAALFLLALAGMRLGAISSFEPCPCTFTGAIIMCMLA